MVTLIEIPVEGAHKPVRLYVSLARDGQRAQVTAVTVGRNYIHRPAKFEKVSETFHLQKGVGLSGQSFHHYERPVMIDFAQHVW